MHARRFLGLLPHCPNPLPASPASLPQADNLVFSVLAVGYTLAAILIFTLQSGYTSIFPPTDDRGAIACSATA